VKAVTIDIRTLADYSVRLKDRQQAAAMVMGNPRILSAKSSGLMVILLHLARHTANISYLIVYPQIDVHLIIH
jgi:hypothetical protein